MEKIYCTTVDGAREITGQELEEYLNYCELAKAEQLRDKSSNARLQRNNILISTDWTQLPNSSVDSMAWATYRQALRDVPSQSGFPDNIVWPVPPT